MNLAVDSGLDGNAPSEPVMAYGTVVFTGQHRVEPATGELTYSATFRLNNSVEALKASIGNADVRSLLGMSIRKAGTEQRWSDTVWAPHKARSNTPFQLSVKIPAPSQTTVFEIFLEVLGMARLTPAGPIESYPYPKPYYAYGAGDVCAPGYYPDGTPCVPSPVPYQAGASWSGTNPTAAGKASLLLDTTAPHLTFARS